MVEGLSLSFFNEQLRVVFILYGIVAFTEILIDTGLFSTHRDGRNVDARKKQRGPTLMGQSECKVKAICLK